MLAIIAAMAQNSVIGLAGEMPWHMPADLRHFKQLTVTKTIIMGRKTFDTLAGPLPNRRNIVVTRNPAFSAPGCDVFLDLDTAILEALRLSNDVMIVGGAHIYQQALSKVNRMYLTFIDAQVEGDTYFPVWQRNAWHQVSVSLHHKDDKNPYDYQFIEYERIAAIAGG